MKIAILFSGRITADKTQYENIMNTIVTTNEVDFFICYQKKTNPEVVEKVISLYQPKKIRENDEQYFPVDKYPAPWESVPHKNRIMSMYKARYLLRKLFQEYIEETNTNYDMLMSTRMDLFYDDKEMIGEYLLPQIQDNRIYIPKKYDYRGINDQIAIGNQTTILNYLNVYESIYELLDSGVLVNPEIILLSYLQYKKQIIIRHSANYHIIRTFSDTVAC
jgi:hypothetical protein